MIYSFTYLSWHVGPSLWFCWNIAGIFGGNQMYLTGDVSIKNITSNMPGSQTYMLTTGKPRLHQLQHFCQTSTNLFTLVVPWLFISWYIYIANNTWVDNYIQNYFRNTISFSQRYTTCIKCVQGVASNCKAKWWAASIQGQVGNNSFQKYWWQKEISTIIDMKIVSLITSCVNYCDKLF